MILYTSIQVKCTQMVCLRAVLKNRKLGAKETEELKQKTKKTKRICSLGSSMKQTRVTAH